MYETSKTAQVLSEIRIYHLDIPGISESRWKGSYISTQEHQQGHMEVT